MTTPTSPGSKFAAVQVWGKGYRVTADTEEFQRYVPINLTPVSKLESAVSAISWGRVLEPLYTNSERELANQRCLLLDPSGLMALAFARTSDKHRRPSIVLTTASTTIDWSSDDLGEAASRAASLSMRLAQAYSDTFRGNPEIISHQLRAGSFLPTRLFDLADEADDRAIDWPSILATIKQWQGITGIATTRMIPLGANIVLGTKHEAERAQQQYDIDGYFDVREKEIRPLSAKITPWRAPQPEVVQAPGLPSPNHPTAPDLRPIIESLDRIDRSVGRLANIASELLEIIFRDRRHK